MYSDEIGTGAQFNFKMDVLEINEIKFFLIKEPHDYDILLLVDLDKSY